MRVACESDLVVVDSRNLLESLLPDHHGGEVGGVAGEHQQAEDGPEVHEKTPGPAFRRLRIKQGGEQKRKGTLKFPIWPLWGGDPRRLSTFCPSVKIAINPGGNQANQNRREETEERKQEALAKKVWNQPSFAEGLELEINEAGLLIVF